MCLNCIEENKSEVRLYTALLAQSVFVLTYIFANVSALSKVQGI